MSETNKSVQSHSGDEPDLLDVIGVLYRYRWFLVLFNVAIVSLALVAAIATLLLPPHVSPVPNIYRSSALLIVNEDRGSGVQAALLAPGLADLAALGGVSRRGGYGELSRRVLSGNSVIDTIVAEFDITERHRIERFVVANSREAVRQRSSFTHDPITSTLTIAYEDWDPEFARRVVDRLTHLLLQRFRAIGVNRAITERDLLQGRVMEVEAEIARLEDAIEAFQRRHGLVTAQTLAAAQISVLAEVRSRLIFKELEIETYGAVAQGNDPVMRQLIAERDNLRSLLVDLEHGTGRLSDVLPSQQEAPRLAIELSRLERDLRVHARILEILSQQFEVARLNAQGEGPIFQILEMADAPDKKHSPRRGVIMIAISAGSVFASVVLAFILNAVVSVRRDPEAIRRITGGSAL